MSKSPINNEPARMKRMVALFNIIPNIFWSCVNIAPIFIFCYGNMQVNMVYFFSAISLFSILLPRAFFNTIQLGSTTAVYKKIGVKFINKFTQNGDLINGLIRKRFPRYTVITRRNYSQKKLLQQTYMFEKFHFSMFIFFILTTLFALSLNQYWWALAICFTNLLYNVYPNFLQQYIRIKIISFSKTGEHRQRVNIGL